MNREERAELAVRIAGVVLTASAFAWLLWGGWQLAVLPGVGLMLAAGVCCVASGGAISRVLLGRRGKGIDSLAGEAIYVGATLVGLSSVVSYAIALATMALTGPYLERFAALLAGLGIGAALIGLAPLLGEVLGRDDAQTTRTAGTGVVLSAGLSLTGLWVCYRTLLWLGMAAPGIWLATPPSSGEQLLWPWLLRCLTESGVGLLLGGMLVWQAPRLSARLLRGRPGRTEREPGSAPIPARGYLQVAILLAIAYVLLQSFRYFRYSPYYVWQGTEAFGTLLRLVALPAIVAAAVFFAGRFIARGIAAWLYTGGEPDTAARAARLRLIFEAGVVVLVLHLVGKQIFDYPQTIVLSSFVPNALLPSLAALGLLVFKGDVARLCLRSKGTDEGELADRRAAMLYPWLILLGVYLLVSSLPSEILWAAARLSGLEQLAPPPMVWASYPVLPDLPPLGIVPGLALAFLARPLSRLLSHGPLLVRKHHG